MAGKVILQKSKAKLNDAIALNGEALEYLETNSEMNPDENENENPESADEVQNEAGSTEDTPNIQKGTKRKASESLDEIEDSHAVVSSENDKQELEAESKGDASFDSQTRRSGRKIRPKKPKTAYDDSPAAVADLESTKEESTDDVNDVDANTKEVSGGRTPSQTSLKSDDSKSGRKIRSKKLKIAYDDSAAPNADQATIKREQMDGVVDANTKEDNPRRRPSSQMSFKSDETNRASPALEKRTKVDLTSPLLRVPMSLGWKRELVYRSKLDHKSKRMGDVYYHSPSGKVLRSIREVAGYLTEGLTIENFTFCKEPLGLNDPNKEVVRDAKITKRLSSSSRPNSPLAVSTSSNSSALGKRTPKPKLPKGASPPPSEDNTIATTSKTPIKVSPKKSPQKPAFKVKLTNARLSDQTKLKHSKILKRRSMPTNVKNPEPDIKVEKQEKTNNTEKTGKPDKSDNPDKTVKSEKLGKLGKSEATKKTIVKKSTIRNNIGNGTKRKRVHETGSSVEHEAVENNDEAIVNSTESPERQIISTHAPFVQHFCLNVSAGYFALLKIFQYLKVQELLRASRVCRFWNEMSNSPSLWRTVRMKNSQVGDWHGFAKSLQKHHTKILDLRKMLIPASVNPDDMWKQFSKNIGLADSLISIDFCRCPAGIIEKLCETNPKMEIINAVTIRDDKLDLMPFASLKNLHELRLKSSGGFEIKNDLSPLKELKNLKHLSITSVKELGKCGCEVIADLVELQSLELGECSDFPEDFGSNVLSKLQKLERLRLEKGQGNCHTFSILECVSQLPVISQLELVNFDIKAGFDKSLALCTNIRRMLIIPTYITQSATTNHMVLRGVIKLSSSLTHFVWGVTLELLRVTELFVDQYENNKIKDKKPLGESIPVLKPVPSLSHQNEDKSEDEEYAAEAPQVEILTLQALQKLLNGSLPQTRVRILKIPFHASWRQSISDSQ